VLIFSNFTKPFKVHTNANDFAIGGVFMQDGHPIAFESKKLSRAQLQWPTHKKELYVIVCHVKAWQHYLGTQKTKVYTDNISLRYFET
jgi:hypothetical protein